jgi:hypothetical protein
MEKDEILAKSRAEGRDEMEISVNEKSSHIGAITVVVVCLFFAATKVLNNGEPFFEFPAIMFAYLSGMHFNNYWKLKKGIYLTTAIAFAFAFLCMTILYFMKR